MIEFICHDGQRQSLPAEKDPETQVNSICSKVVEGLLGYKTAKDAKQNGSHLEIDLPWRLEGSGRGRSDHCTFVIKEDPFHSIVLGLPACEDLKESKDKGLYPLGRPSLTEGQATLPSIAPR